MAGGGDADGEDGRIRWWQRLRAVLGLGVAGILLGAGLAVTVAIVVVLVAAALERAVG